MPGPALLCGRLLTVVATAVALGGCASTGELLSHAPRRPSARPAAPPPAAPPRAPGLSAADVAVIEAWSTSLRTGHVAAAARYFDIPSLFYTGNGPPVQLRSLGAVQIANASLPCGARFLSAHRDGRYINALFRLTNRPGPGGDQGCGSGTGLTARTDFLIRDGRIVQWIRAPDEPGDNGTPRTTPQPTAPDTTPGGGTPAA